MTTATYAVPLGIPRFKSWLPTGQPNIFGKANIYVAGTSTADVSYPTYDDAIAGTNANPNPLILDATGEGTLFLQAGRSYKLIVTDANNVVLPGGTMDDITPAGTADGELPRTAFAAVKLGTQTGFVATPKLVGWTVQRDSLSEWDGANNRVQVKYAGVYLILAALEVADASAHVAVTPSIYLNGNLIGSSVWVTTAPVGDHMTIVVSKLVAMNVGDFIDIRAQGSANTSVFGTPSSAWAMLRTS